MKTEPTVTCSVCGEEVDASTRFHWARPYTDPENDGHYVDGFIRGGGGQESPQEPEGMAPPPPERPKVPKELRKTLVPLEEDVR